MSIRQRRFDSGGARHYRESPRLMAAEEHRESPKMPKVFVSCRRLDASEAAFHLYLSLCEKLGQESVPMPSPATVLPITVSVSSRRFPLSRGFLSASAAIPGIAPPLASSRATAGALVPIHAATSAWVNPARRRARNNSSSKANSSACFSYCVRIRGKPQQRCLFGWTPTPRRRPPPTWRRPPRPATAPGRGPGTPGNDACSG